MMLKFLGLEIIYFQFVDKKRLIISFTYIMVFHSLRDKRASGEKLILPRFRYDV